VFGLAENLLKKFTLYTVTQFLTLRDVLFVVFSVALSSKYCFSRLSSLDLVWKFIYSYVFCVLFS